MPPKPWAASFKVNKDTGGAEGNVFWGSMRWWMIVVLQHSPSQAPRCQLPWQVCLSFLLAVQNLPMPARCSVCKALNSRKPVSLSHHTEPFTPANWIHKNAPEIQPSVFCCFLWPVWMNCSASTPVSPSVPELSSRTPNTSVIQLPQPHYLVEVTLNKMKQQIYRNLDINSFNNCH